MVHLWRNSVRTPHLLHRLVAEAFIGDPQPGKECVAHFNGDKMDNRSDNLRWASRPENEGDKLRHGKHQIGERNSHATLTQKVVDDIRADAIRGARNRDIVQKYEISSSHASRICSGKRWPEMIAGHAYFRGQRVL